VKDAPLISVIVPVYNVEKYIEQCVESLVAQDYPNLEIILVDDGATDSSGPICDRLAREYKNVVTYHKNNGGPSEARNYGLARSHGEWISLVDSDDYVSPAFISALYNAAQSYGHTVAGIPHGKDFKDGQPCVLVERVNLIRSDVSQNNRAANSRALEKGSSLSVNMMMLDAHEAIRELLYQEIDTGAGWRLFRRDVLGTDPFPVGLYYEDLATVYKIIYRAGGMVLVDCPELYAYRILATSITRQAYRHIKAYSAISVASQMYEDIAGWYPDLAQACSSRCFSVCRMVYAQVPKGKKATEEEQSDRRELWHVIRANRNVVANDPGARKRERLAANIARLGEGPFSCFCSLARAMGLMR
jgi:glycosyltransferase involved in cell wall biosynthesis